LRVPPNAEPAFDVADDVARPEEGVRVRQGDPVYVAVRRRIERERAPDRPVRAVHDPGEARPDSHVEPVPGTEGEVRAAPRPAEEEPQGAALRLRVPLSEDVDAG